MSAIRRIALFGGTFDPVHLGHIFLAREARVRLSLDEVRFLPCHISPHKTSAPASAVDRLQMLRFATEKFPWAVVDDFELQRPPPSYSWQTAEAMEERFPSARLFWIMGSDQWDALPNWAHPEKLSDIVEFIVFSRDSQPEEREGFRLHALNAQHPASSTAIREAISKGKTRHPWLLKEVSQWIEIRGLYR